MHFKLFYLLTLLIGTLSLLQISATPIKRFVLGVSFGNTDLRDSAAQNTIILWQETYLEQSFPFQANNNSQFMIDIRIMHHGNNLSLALENYRTLAEDPDLIAFMLPFPVSFSIPIYLEIIRPTGKTTFMVPVQAILSGNPGLFSFAPTPEQLISTSLYTLRFVGVRTVLILQTSEPDAAFLCGDGMTTSLRNLGVIATHRYIVHVQSLNQSAEITKNLTDTIHILASISHQFNDFDAILMCAYSPSNQIIIDAFSRWSPKALIALPQIQPVSSLLSIMPATFVSGPIVWSPILPYPGDQVFGSPQAFSDTYSLRFGAAPIGASAGTAAILAVFESALRDSYRISRSGEPSSEDLSFSLYRIDLETVFGRIRFNSFGENISDPPFLQYFPDYSSHFNNTNLTFSSSTQGEQRLDFLPDQQPKEQLWKFDTLSQRVVYPPRLQTNDFLYPIPMVADRTESTDWFEYHSEIGVITLNSIGIVISFGWAIFVFFMRAHDAIRYAAPYFLYIMIFGTIILYLSIFTWMLYVTDATCMALPWLIISGFSIYFGAILIKLYRIWKVTDAASAFRHYSVPLQHIWALWILILFPPLILLIVMTAVAPLTAQIRIPDPLRPSTIYYDCHASNDAQIFIGFLGGYCLLLFMAAFFVIKKTWKIDRVVLNESIWLAFAVWTLLLCAIIAVVVIATSAIERETEFVVRSLTLILGVSFSLSIFFIPKVSYIRAGKSLHNRSGSNSTGITPISAHRDSGNPAGSSR